MSMQFMLARTCLARGVKPEPGMLSRFLVEAPRREILRNTGMPVLMKN